MTAAPSLRPHAWVALAGLALLLGWELSGLDRVVTGWFADSAGFPLRDHWLAWRWLHDGGKRVADLVLLMLFLRLLWPGSSGPGRRERGYWLLVVLACILLVQLLKRMSDTSCPWSLAEFGGQVPYVPHWKWWDRDGGPGSCFPSGHAVAAFGFLPHHFLWRTRSPTAARAWLMAIGVAGLLFGAAQLVRGAHFVSHTLWTAWLCWVLALLAARLAPVAARRGSAV